MSEPASDHFSWICPSCARRVPTRFDACRCGFQRQNRPPLIAEEPAPEYAKKVGWGHSSTEHVVTFAQIAKVRRLVMFHHDPLHTDADLEAILLRAKEMWGENGGEIGLAHEGMEIDLA